MIIKKRYKKEISRRPEQAPYNPPPKKQDPLEFDNGFGAFEYKKPDRPAQTNTYANPQKQVPPKKPQTNKPTQFEWKPEEFVVEEPRGNYAVEEPRGKPAESEGFNWENPSNFEFDNQPKPLQEQEYPTTTTNTRLVKPGIFATQHPKPAATRASQSPPVAPPQKKEVKSPPVAKKETKSPPKKEAKAAPTKAPAAAPVLVDLLTDTPAQLGLPEDLFETPPQEISPPVVVPHKHGEKPKQYAKEESSDNDYQLEESEENKVQMKKPEEQYVGLLGKKEDEEQDWQLGENSQNPPNLLDADKKFEQPLPQAINPEPAPQPTPPKVAPKVEPPKPSLDWEKMINQNPISTESKTLIKHHLEPKTSNDPFTEMPFSTGNPRPQPAVAPRGNQYINIIYLFTGRQAIICHIQQVSHKQLQWDQ